MSKEKLGQEPAFPELTTEYDGQGSILPYQVSGMSKRFYAACAAMQGLLSNIVKGEQLTTEQLIGVAYECADELLKQENE